MRQLYAEMYKRKFTSKMHTIYSTYMSNTPKILCTYEEIYCDNKVEVEDGFFFGNLLSNFQFIAQN